MKVGHTLETGSGIVTILIVLAFTAWVARGVWLRSGEHADDTAWSGAIWGAASAAVYGILAAAVSTTVLTTYG